MQRLIYIPGRLITVLLIEVTLMADGGDVRAEMRGGGDEGAWEPRLCQRLGYRACGQTQVHCFLLW